MLLKTILHGLIKTYGLAEINNAIAEIYCDLYEKKKEVMFDELSEAYDNINYRFFVVKKFENERHSDQSQS
jgi:hypothetical protein